MLMLIAHALPLSDTPLPQPVPVASITEDAAMLGGLDARARLTTIANMLGLQAFEILECDTPLTPQTQLLLPFHYTRFPRGVRHG